MYFAVIGRDKPGMAALRLSLRPAHRERLKDPGKHPVIVRLGGPLLDSDGAMDGTLLVVEADSAEAVHAYLKDDPYCVNDIFAQLEVRSWNWSLGQPAANQVVAP